MAEVFGQVLSSCHFSLCLSVLALFNLDWSMWFRLVILQELSLVRSGFLSKPILRMLAQGLYIYILYP